MANIAIGKQALRDLAQEFGFADAGIAGVSLDEDERRLERWLADERHGEMAWMARHGSRRSRPAELRPGTRSVIVVRMDYLPRERNDPMQLLDHESKAYVSRYALGRDYHKLVRRRLKRLAERIGEVIAPHGYRVFTDSAPVLEKPLARNAGIGWIGKHTNLIDKQSGSWFFLGEIFTDLPLEPDQPATDHCGTCRRCIDICPTAAITAPYELDARRCISYLTIELKGSIPPEFRKPMGNRIYGCDDCQLVCPWNKFAQPTGEADFQPRHGLDDADLVELFGWSRQRWDAAMRGSAIRRIGYENWLRNIAVALGNAATTRSVVDALRARADDASPVVREHVSWALEQHRS